MCSHLKKMFHYVFCVGFEFKKMLKGIYIYWNIFKLILMLDYYIREVTIFNINLIF